MRVFDRFRLWNRARAAINQVVREKDPAAIERLLRQFPAESGNIARRARSMADVYPLPALLLAVALARCAAPETVDLLRWLAGREFGWDRLAQGALHDLRRALVDRGETDLLDAVRRRLDDHQLAWVLPDVGAEDFLEELERLQGGQALGVAVQLIVDFVADVTLRGRPAGDGLDGLDNAADAALLWWERGHLEDALQLWTVLAIAEPRQIETDCLRLVADALPAWIPLPEPVSFEGLPAGGQIVVPVPPRVVRAADLLADFPSVDWIEPLRRAWLAADDLVRRVERRNQAVEKHNELIAQHHKGKDVIDAIRKQQDEIGRQDDGIAQARAALREELTPAALLLHTVSDAQAYPLEVRQGAAWGLHRIVADGALEAEAGERVSRTLRAALRGQELDESALRGRITAVLPDGDGRVRDLLVAAERYAADHDAERLAVTVGRLAPEGPAFAKEIRDGVDSSLQSQTRGELGERVLRVLPGASLPELLGVLRRGLCWMAELVEGRAGGEPALAENLPWIAALIGEERSSMSSRTTPSWTPSTTRSWRSMARRSTREPLWRKSTARSSTGTGRSTSKTKPMKRNVPGVRRSTGRASAFPRRGISPIISVPCS